MGLKIVTINTQGLLSDWKQFSLADKLLSLKADVAFLQETHFTTTAEVDRFENTIKGKVVSASGSNHRAGTAIVFLASFLACGSILSTSSDPVGHWVKVDVQYCGSRLSFLNVHGPTYIPERRRFFNDILPLLETCSDDIILAGDFNCVLDPALDRRSAADVSRDTSVGTLSTLLRTCGLTDAFRFLNPIATEYTWTSPTGSSSSRLDRVYCSRGFRGCLVDASHEPFALSDHMMVVAAFDSGDWIGRGAGVWKLNTSLLQDKRFCCSVRDYLVSCVARRATFASVGEFWEYVKDGLKELAISFGRIKARRRRRAKRKLDKSFATVQTRVAQGETHLTELLERLRRKIKANERQSYEAAGVRARVKWDMQGEQPTRYFCSLEKTRGIEKLMRGITLGNNVTETTTKGMLEAAREFYQNLFSSQGVDQSCVEELLGTLTNYLSADEADLCDAPLTVHELFLAAKSMALNKSPGIDGLPVELYISFWDILGPILLEVAMEAVANKSLPPTMQQAVVRLIHKRGSKEDLKNWRPISLLCADYKIITKALTRRLGSVIGSVVHSDQTCSVPGRSILSGGMLVRDLIVLVEGESAEAALISLDNEKAFDRVEWEFTLSVLRSMGFGPHFREWVSLMYKSPVSRLLVNGFLSNEVYLARGVRQGCPLSPLLYVLGAEVLGAAIRKSSFQGIRLPFVDEPVKVAQYADDTTLFVGCNEDLALIKPVLVKYEKASGARVNRDKSKGLFLGAWKDRTDAPLGIEWNSKSLKLLGVEHAPQAPAVLNWAPALDRVSSTLNGWSKRSLSLVGRVLVLNLLAMSKLWYVGTVYDMPTVHMKNLQTMVCKFLWSGKKPRVSLQTCSLPKHKGGLGLVNIIAKLASLKLKFLGGLVSCGDRWACVGRALFHYRLKPCAIHHLFHWAELPESVNKIPAWCSEVLRNAFRFSRHASEPACWQQALSQPLFSNPMVLDGRGRPFQPGSLGAKGIVYLSDIIKSQDRSWKVPDAQLTSSGYRQLSKVKDSIKKAWFNLPDVGGPNSCYSVNDIPVEQVTSRTWYNWICQTNETEPASFTKWQLVGIRPVSWESAFQSVFDSPIPNRDKAIHWLLLHRQLWVGTNLVRAMVANTDQCPLCKSPGESLVHIFLRCGVTVRIWTIVNGLLGRYLGRAVSLGDHFVLFGEGFTTNKKCMAVIRAVALTAVGTLWRHRCYAVAHTDPLDHVVAFKRFFLRDLTHLLMCEFERARRRGNLDDFVDIWCRNNCFASVTNGSLQVRLDF